MQIVVSFVGKYGGKTALLERKTKGVFSKALSFTMEDEYEVSVNTGTEIAHLKIWDTSGSDDFIPLTDTHINESDVVVFVFSISERLTYDAVNFLSQRVPQDGSKALILVSNMIDNEDSREISREEAQGFARARGMKYIETSAKTNQNVDALFELIVSEYRNKHPERAGGTSDGSCEVF